MAYNKKTWSLTTPITPEELNRMEQGIYDNDTSIINHIDDTNNPHQVTTEQINTYNKTTIDSKVSTVQDDLDNHKNNSNNPHSITASQINTYTKTEIDNNFVTKTTYNQLASTSQDGLMSKNDKIKLDGIESGANKYIHPSTHPASMITQDSSHRFVTDNEKAVWNSKEPAFSKNTAFNKNFGTISGTVCEGNDYRLFNSRRCNNTFDNVEIARNNLNIYSKDQVDSLIDNLNSGSVNIELLFEGDISLSSNNHIDLGIALNNYDYLIATMNALNSTFAVIIGDRYGSEDCTFLERYNLDYEETDSGGLGTIYAFESISIITGGFIRESTQLKYRGGWLITIDKNGNISWTKDPTIRIRKVLGVKR